MTTYYVDPVSGSDAAAGTSFGAAWLTTQKAADTAVAGDEVRCCQTGVESIAAKIDLDTNAGTASSHIRFLSYNSDGTVQSDGYTISASAAITAILDFAIGSDYTYWTGFIFDGNTTGGAGNDATYGIYNAADGSDGHVFLRCRITDCDTTNVYVRGLSTWLFVECECDLAASYGIASSAANRGLVWWLYGSIHDNGNHGWLVNRDSSKCDYCLVYDNAGDGLSCGTNSNFFEFNHNTVYGNTGDGISLDATDGASTLSYNSCSGNGGYGFNFNASTVAVRYAGYNHTHNNTSGASDVTMPGSNNQTGDPLFASVTDGSEDFTPDDGSPLDGNGFNGLDIGAVGAADPVGGGGGGPLVSGRLVR